MGKIMVQGTVYNTEGNNAVWWEVSRKGLFGRTAYGNRFNTKKETKETYDKAISKGYKDVQVSKEKAPLKEFEEVGYTKIDKAIKSKRKKYI